MKHENVSLGAVRNQKEDKSFSVLVEKQLALDQLNAKQPTKRPRGRPRKEKESPTGSLCRSSSPVSTSKRSRFETVSVYQEAHRTDDDEHICGVCLKTIGGKGS